MPSRQLPALTCPSCKHQSRPEAKFCGQCGHQFIFVYRSLQPDQSLNQGQFTILRTLSRGGMGEIFLAQDHQAFGRQVVIKAMRDYFDPTKPLEVQAARERFEQEARTLAQLKHAGIPTIFTYFKEDDGSNFIVMEYIEGKNLEERLSRVEKNQSIQGTPYGLNRVVSFGRLLCKILEYLASLDPPVVHHDIKPANIILDKHANTIRLVDFGTARARLIAQPNGRIGGQRSSIYGTQGYAPPEQHRGKSEPRSDIYALAATLYHLATDDDPGNYAFKFPMLEELGPFGAALEPALDHDPKRRPDAATLRATLERLPEIKSLPAPDGSRLYSEAALVRWCQANQLAAQNWLAFDLCEQINTFWKKATLATTLRTLRKTHPTDLELALDLALRELKPTLPQPTFELSVKDVDFGLLVPGKANTCHIEVFNSGQALCVLALQASNWLMVTPPQLRLAPNERQKLTIQATGATKSGQKIEGVVEINPHVGSQARIIVRASFPKVDPVVAVPAKSITDRASVPKVDPVAAVPVKSITVGHRSISAHDEVTCAVSACPTGTMIASTGANGTLRLWRDDTRLIQIIRAHKFRANDVAWSPDGRTLTTVGQDRYIRVWIQPLHKRPQIEWVTPCVALTVTYAALNGRWLITGSVGGSVNVWDAQTGKALAKLDGHRDDVLRVIASPTRLLVASAGKDGLVAIWDVARRCLQQQLRGHIGWASGLAWSPDGSQLASGGEDREIRLWDATDGKLLKTLKGHTAGITTIAWSPDGKWLVSAGQDKIIYLWNIHAGVLFKKPSAYTGSIWSVAFLWDSVHFVSGGVEPTNSVRLWRIKEST